MATLDSEYCAEDDAVAAPVKALDLPRPYREGTGLYVIRFAALDDEDFLPIPDPDGEINSLYFNGSGMLVRTTEFRRQDPHMLEGFLHAYNDGLSNALQAVIEQAVPQPV